MHRFVNQNVAEVNDFYKTELREFYERQGYCNPVIDLLIRKWIIKTPIYIKSVWWVRWKKTMARQICANVFINGYWSIFYNYNEDPGFLYVPNLYVKYPYPDTVAIHLVNGTLEQFIDRYQFFLKHKFKKCSFYEANLILENYDQENQRLQQSSSESWESLIPKPSSGKSLISEINLSPVIESESLNEPSSI